MTERPASATRHLEIACGAGKVCPISSGPCPGECIFADIMASVGLGIVLFDLGARSILFANQWAREFFARVDVPVEYARMESLLLRDLPETLPDPHARQLRLANRFLGSDILTPRPKHLQIMPFSGLGRSKTCDICAVCAREIVRVS
jgi:hypothetical protein